MALGLVSKRSSTGTGHAYPTKTLTPLSIASVGGGKIGSCFAYQLARAGHRITVVARPGSRRLAQLQRDGGIVINGGAGVTTSVADALDPVVPYHLVIVTTLSHQIDAILPALKNSQASAIHFMFNTFDPEHLAQAVGTERASFGMPMVIASLDSDGVLNPVISARRKTLHGDKRWVELFEASGIPSLFQADMKGWLRCHVAICTGMEAIAIAAKRRGAGASWSEALTVARGKKATFAILAALGYPVFPRAKANLARTPGGLVAAMMWCVSRVPMIREGFSNGLGECRALIGDVLIVARQNGRAVSPVSLRQLAEMMPSP